MSQPELTAAVIGAGYFARFHLDAWARIPEVKIAALCDLDERRAVECCSDFDIARHYTDAAEMLDAERPDFVDIVTRPDTHLALCELAARRQLPIICQKPLAPTYAEARQIIQTVTAADVPFMVHENFRFQPWHREMKRLIRDGRIGTELQSIALRSRMGDGWQKDAYLNRQPYFRTMPRLLIHESGVHFIDTFRFLMGDVRRVFASLRRLNPDIQGEDTGYVWLEFESGATGEVHATRYHESESGDPRYTFGEYTVDGNRGTLRVDLEGRLFVKPLGQPVVEHAYQHSRHGFAGDCVLPTQQHFVDQLLGARQFETRGDEYVKTLAVAEAVYQSAATRAVVDVEVV